MTAGGGRGRDGGGAAAAAAAETRNAKRETAGGAGFNPHCLSMKI